MSEIEQAEAALSEASLHPSGGKARGMLYRSLTALLAEHKRLLSEHTVHDADTLWKVYDALSKVGVIDQQATDAITQIQNAGILFRERPKEQS